VERVQRQDEGAPEKELEEDAVARLEFFDGEEIGAEEEDCQADADVARCDGCRGHQHRGVAVRRALAAMQSMRVCLCC
jgi:hypothetical protein